ncbi:YebC/PmpR family DNA-binding transcriptional regulator [Moritella sp. Urea-trap-13]|uniref:YebC/PmpR family DNA-binding transcriptional regulator n=1 Tax=Moritella sp. Urea-trap-13 TaxID=2058327 RepID=UPI000C34ACC8|nr:YebC/PmpR family DNA-binding transcriptional regulator [Moritella sp. Urea-trap-13]PKH04667.1 YebC/PmpR family DNA-binding transcriptional regulator [Moritella sp. Urea-trap-13]
MGRAFQNRKLSMAKTAGMKTKIYSKYGKEIYVCAKTGGGDPDHNLSLRRIIEKAKKDQVPTHVIDRAIEKAAGAGGEDYVRASYEGFGPGNCMVIVECLTDNGKRTFTDVRQAFVKNGAKLGAQGSVSHMFDHQAVFEFKFDDEDAVLEALMEAEVDVADVENEDGTITVYVPHTEFFKTKVALSEAFADIEFDAEDITFLPQIETEVVGDDAEMFERFLAALNDSDDVQEIYHNAIVA